MKNKISVVITTKNSEETLGITLKSVTGLADEIVLVDNYSSDHTVDIAKKYRAKIFYFKPQHQGRHLRFAISKAKYKWILLLDSDEELSSLLKKEIKNLLKKNLISKYDGYLIPFQSYLFRRKIFFGGEYYKKIRLFKKNKIKIIQKPIHSFIDIPPEKIGILKNKINHYSYRSFSQTFKKFTYYAWQEARMKFVKKEKLTIKKLILYPLHMFYARFIEDKGYKDGIWRIPLDLGFAYMELMTYFFLLILKIRQKFK
jgi:glycosyltransferase involved in cell wall biosynthesis